MCGIAGFVRLDGSNADRGSLDRLTHALAHRGPDGRGVHAAGNVGLCHCRLAILDLTEAAAQPMSGDSGCTLTFNGEIYNFRELRERLEKKGVRFRSTGDTEVLLKLYEDEGPACVARLEGMFAFAVHDPKRGILFMARDRMGKKPLKYFHVGKTFAFSSELKALRALPECPREFDRAAILRYLTLMYVPSPDTGFAGIRKLPAAHTLTLDLATGTQTIERYWSPPTPIIVQRSEEEWIERIDATFTEAVRKRMVADVPVGAFLSGGIDSGAVVAAMATLSGRPVETFSIGSADERMNELPDALLTAKKFGTNHHPIVVEPNLPDMLPQLAHAYEEPFADPSSIPTMLVARAARQRVTVALNGDGGDENFAGYVRYKIAAFANGWAKVPGPVHRLVEGGASLFHLLRKDTFSMRCLRFERSMRLPESARYLETLSFFSEPEVRSLLCAGVDPQPTGRWYSDRVREASERGGLDPVRRAMHRDYDTYLADDLLPKVDIATMAVGLEARSPFLDPAMLELTAGMPTTLLIRGGTRKWIQRKWLTGTLPDDIVWKKKRGFRIPLDAWFRGPLASWVDERLLSAPPAFHEIFDRRAVEAFLREYRSSRMDLSDHVWALLWLCEWMDQYASDR
jgi:asparagine synthase (glutamine-hydrolysing)